MAPLPRQTLIRMRSREPGGGVTGWPIKKDEQLGDSGSKTNLVKKKKGVQTAEGNMAKLQVRWELD